MLPAHASSPYSPHTSQHLPTSPYTALHLQAHASLEEDEELDEEALLDFAPQLGAPATLALALALTLTLTLTLTLALALALADRGSGSAEAAALGVGRTEWVAMQASRGF